MTAAHKPTEAKRAQVRLLRAMFDWSHERIAQMLGIHVSTLTQHYAADLLSRDAALAAVTAENVSQIHAKATEGNVSALKLMREIIQQTALGGPAVAAGAEKLGKKVMEAMAAERAGEGSEWGDDLVAGPPN